MKPRAKRSNVFIEAHLDAEDPLTYGQPVRIRDLSEKGARLQGNPPPVDARVTVRRGKVAMAGRVAWMADFHFGVEFDEPVDTAKVMRAAVTTTPSRPIYAAALTSTLPQLGRYSPHVRPPRRASFGTRPAI